MTLHAPVLAIETSCDDTACAILSPDGTILAENVLSQMDHAALGGVVPEIAARAHLDVLPEITRQTLTAAGLKLADLGAIAASSGPGLIGGLIVGNSFAQGLALASGTPFVAVNHIEGHALSPRLPGIAGATPLHFPYLLLLVSGGHCQCVAVRAVGDYDLLGGTIDDAAGEAFDKVAKMLGLGWPGGPAVEALAHEGDPTAFEIPRPLLGRVGCDFSFSGLKTAVSRKLADYGMTALPRKVAADMAASVQAAIADIMADRARHAADLAPDCTALVVAGGVAANQAIRARLQGVAAERGWPFLAPPLRLCTDNAVMIAWAAIERLAARGEIVSDLGLKARPRWPLAEMRIVRPHDPVE